MCIMKTFATSAPNFPNAYSNIYYCCLFWFVNNCKLKQLAAR